MASTTINKKKTANDWLKDVLEDICISTCEEVPAGWLTHREMKEIAGVASSTMNHRIEKLLTNKKIQRKKFRISTGRSVSAVWHYYKSEIALQ